MNEWIKNRLLTHEEAAEYLGITKFTLTIWELTMKHNLPVIKMGELTKYRYGDLLEFSKRRTIKKPANDNITTH